MKNLSVLFYLEPWTENKKPWFRHFPVRAILNRLSSAINDAGGTTTIVCGEGTHFTIHENGWGFENFSTQIVLEEKPLRTLARSYSEFVDRDKGDPAALAKGIESLYPSLAGQKFDIVFVWESQCNYLKHLVKSDHFVYLSPGMLSRDPYPYHITVDFCGLFAQSWLATKSAAYLKLKTTISQLDVQSFPIDAVLDATESFVAYRARNSLPGDIKRRIKQFSKTYCLPLQTSDYFASNNSVTGNKQWDMLIDTLDRAPVDAGIVVTHYVSPGLEERVVLRDNINFLQSKYPNLIYSEELDKIASPSQILLYAVDGVISISSSVGLQAKILGKELIAVGESHLSPFGNTWDAPPEKTISQQHARLLKYLHGRYFIPTDLVFKNGDSVGKFIDAILGRKKDGLIKPFHDDELADYYQTTAVEQARRVRKGAKSALAPIDFARTVMERLASKEIKVVSFDVFDTIVQRELFTPAAVFDLVERRAQHGEFKQSFKRMMRDSGAQTFRSLRMVSEQEARKRLAAFDYEDCNFDEIYEQLATHTDDAELIQFLKTTELDLELDVIKTRMHGKLLYELARASGKQVIFTSDMYLPSSIIEEILKRNNLYAGERIYVSSEIRLRKHSGNLFLHILKDLTIAPEELFHIGDAIHGDYTSPKRFGINASLVPAARDYWKQTYGQSYKKQGADNLTEEVIFGGQAMQVYDFPYHALNENGYFRGRAELFGYSVAGPLLAGLCDWLNKGIQQQAIGKLFFFARDGHVVKHVFEEMFDSAINGENHQYVHVSRRVLAISAIIDHDDIVALTKQRFEPMALEQFVRIRFGLDLWALTSDEVDQVLADTSLTSISDIISTSNNSVELSSITRKLEPRIFKHASAMRAKVKAYLEKIGLKPTAGKKVGVFDIGYSGSLQRYIEKIFGTNFTEGFYFATFVGAKALYESGGVAHGYAGQNIDPRITKHQFVHAVHIFETIFSHTDGSTFSFMENSGEMRPVLTAEQDLNGKNQFVSKLWQGIDEFLLTYTKYRELIDWSQFNWEKALKPFDDFVLAPLIDDLHMLDDVKFENLYCGERSAPIVDYRDLDARALWNYGQKKVKEYTLQDRAAINHLTCSKPFETLQEYITMIYEEEFIRHLMRSYENVADEYEKKIDELKTENFQLKEMGSLTRLPHEGGQATRKHRLGTEFLTAIDSWFSEAEYLKANPDVGLAIANGAIKSGLSHFKEYGYKEGRKLRP